MTKEEKIKGLYSLKEYLIENPIELEGHKSLPITLIDYAIKALEQESVLDKIYTDIQRLRGCSCWCSDGIIDDVEDIIDKYRAESENE